METKITDADACVQVLGEIRNPRRTLTIAAPLAVGGVTILYVLANVCESICRLHVLIRAFFADSLAFIGGLLCCNSKRRPR